MDRTRIVASALLLATLASLFAGQLLFRQHGIAASRTLVIAGVALYALALALLQTYYDHPPADDPVAPPSRTLEWWCVAALLALALALRTIQLDTLPLRLDGDTAAFAVGAQPFLSADPPPLFGTGWQAHTNLYFWLLAQFQRIFGPTVIGMRAFAALGGTLGVLATYALARALWNPRAGLLAGLALAVQPFHLVFSRVGTEVVHLTWLLPLTILCIWRGWRDRSRSWLILGGAVAGLSQYFYPGARLLPILAVAQIGLLAWFPPDGARSIRRSLRALLWLGLGFVVVYGPMIAYYLERPDTYTARLKLVSIFDDGWWARATAQQPWWLALGEQLRRAALPFVFPTPGARMWYLWPQYLRPLDAALLSLALLAVAVGRDLQRWLRFWLLCFWGAAIVLAGVVTINTPMPSRYMIFMPIVALLIGWTLDWLIRTIAPLLTPAPCRPARVLGGLALGLYAAVGVYSYVQHDTEATAGADITSAIATYAARYLVALPDQHYDIFFLRSDLRYYNANPALPFLTRKPGTDLDAPLTCDTLAAVVQRDSVFIAPPDRIAELAALSTRLPTADYEVLGPASGGEAAAILRLPVPASGLHHACASGPIAETSDD
jgi:hypothetical protein